MKFKRNGFIQLPILAVGGLIFAAVVLPLVANQLNKRQTTQEKATADCVPPLPSSFWGTVSLAGSGSSSIEAKINGTTFASSNLVSSGNSISYSINVPGDLSCTGQVEGGVTYNTGIKDAVNFYLNGQLCTPVGGWVSGSSTRLDLTCPPPVSPTLTPAQATATLTPRPTAIPTLVSGLECGYLMSNQSEITVGQNYYFQYSAKNSNNHLIYIHSKNSDGSWGNWQYVTKQSYPSAGPDWCMYSGGLIERPSVGVYEVAVNILNQGCNRLCGVLNQGTLYSTTSCEQNAALTQLSGQTCRNTCRKTFTVNAAQATATPTVSPASTPTLIPQSQRPECTDFSFDHNAAPIRFSYRVRNVGSIILSSRKKESNGSWGGWTPFFWKEELSTDKVELEAFGNWGVGEYEFGVSVFSTSCRQNLFCGISGGGTLYRVNKCPVSREDPYTYLPISGESCQNTCRGTYIVTAAALTGQPTATLTPIATATPTLTCTLSTCYGSCANCKTNCGRDCTRITEAADLRRICGADWVAVGVGYQCCNRGGAACPNQPPANATTTPVVPQSTNTPIPGCQGCIVAAGAIEKAKGNANCDDAINGVDFELWREELLGLRTTKTADFNCDQKIDGVDFELWRRNKQ